MANEDLIREIVTKACCDALQQKSQELAEEVARRVGREWAKSGEKLASQPAPAAATSERTKELLDGALRIAASRTQTETLETLIGAVSAVTPACGLMILRGTQATGWSCNILATLERFKRTTMDCAQGVAARVISSCAAAVVKASELDAGFIAALGLESSEQLLLVPILLKRRVAALLIALPRQSDDLAAVELLVQITQLTLELQAARKAAPQSPVEAPHPAVQKSVAPEPKPEIEKPEVAPEPPKPEAETELTKVEPVAAQSEPAQAPAQLEPESAAQSEPEPVPEQLKPEAETELTKVESVATQPEPEAAAEQPEPAPVQAQSEPEPAPEQPETEPAVAQAEPAPAQAEPEPAPAPAPEQAEPEAAHTATVPAEVAPVALPSPEPVYAAIAPEKVLVTPPVPVVQIEAPAPQASVTVPHFAPPIPDETHEKARRFAKLLVEEIKLYNPTKLVEGRARGDLYSRLRDDIEKSRGAYQKRYGESVRDIDYFAQELLRILADNNPAMMGAGFPG
jgi:hypothetical protein